MTLCDPPRFCFRQGLACQVCKLARRALGALGVTIDDVIPDVVIEQARAQITYARAKLSVESIAHTALSSSETRYPQPRPDGVH